MIGNKACWNGEENKKLTRKKQKLRVYCQKWISDSIKQSSCTKNRNSRNAHKKLIGTHKIDLSI